MTVKVYASDTYYIAGLGITVPVYDDVHFTSSEDYYGPVGSELNLDEINKVREQVLVNDTYADIL